MHDAFLCIGLHFIILDRHIYLLLWLTDASIGAFAPAVLFVVPITERSYNLFVCVRTRRIGGFWGDFFSPETVVPITILAPTSRQVLFGSHFLPRFEVCVDWPKS